MAQTGSTVVRPIPVQKNLTILQGAAFSLQVTLFNSSGTAFDLTSYTGRGEIRRSKSKTSTLLATFAVSIDAPPTDGKLTISLGATITDAISIDGYYDVEIENTGDPEDVRRVLQGSVKIDKNVTAA